MASCRGPESIATDQWEGDIFNDMLRCSLSADGQAVVYRKGAGFVPLPGDDGMEVALVRFEGMLRGRHILPAYETAARRAWGNLLSMKSQWLVLALPCV